MKQILGETDIVVHCPTESGPCHSQELILWDNIQGMLLQTGKPKVPHLQRHTQAFQSGSTYANGEIKSSTLGASGEIHGSCRMGSLSPRSAGKHWQLESRGRSELLMAFCHKTNRCLPHSSSSNLYCLLLWPQI